MGEEQNPYGELGHGDTVERLQPSKMMATADAVDVACGNEQTILVRGTCLKSLEVTDGQL